MHEVKRPAGQGQAAEETNDTFESNATVIPLQRADDETCDVEGFKPLLPEGIWLEAKYIGHKTALIFRRQPKVFLRFRVVQAGPYLGVELFRLFRVRMLKPNGKFKVHAGGDLYRLLVRLLQLKQRTDRPSLTPLRAMLFRVRTKTVQKNSDQQDHPMMLRYTVIDEIERGE
jgi:hypothetical protein